MSVWFRYLVAAGLILIGVAFILMILTGCMLVVETRSTADCSKDRCKAESSLKRSAEKGEMP